MNETKSQFLKTIKGGKHHKGEWKESTINNVRNYET